jgi:hypothetical protein
LEDPDPVWNLRSLAEGLIAAGHPTRCLLVADAPQQDPSWVARRVVCNPDIASADLKFALPGFAPHRAQRVAFDQLTDRQLSQYREALRRALDREVDEFNPHLIHADAIWLWGHLALETGAAYVLSASLAELETRQANPRFARFTDEAAENAGRILVAENSVRAAVLDTFDVSDARVVQVAPGAHDEIAAVYRRVLKERYGDEPDW